MKVLDDKKLEQEVREAVLQVGREILDHYIEYVSDEIIQLAIDDVFECSALSDGEDLFSRGDVVLAIQRALSGYLNR